jgi:hypothetical protein
MSHRPGTSRGGLLLLVMLVGAGGVFAVWQSWSNRTEPVVDEKQPDSPEFPIPPYSESSYLNTRPEAQYIGSAACAECHRGNHESYKLTPHSKALSDLDLKEEPADDSFEHKASGRSYRVYRKDGKLHHEEVLRTAEGKEIARVDYPIRYLIGSGHFTRSYIIEVDGFLHESPITWYTSRQKWDVSPGYDYAQHWGFERPILLGCITCHAGRVQEDGKSAHRLKFGEKAIGCENCHGPGSLHQTLHVAKKYTPGEIDATIVHPGKVSRSLQESICAACHQSGSASVLVRGRQEGEFRPGRLISDYVIHYRFSGASDQMTVVGHMEQLRQSACYQKSSDMTCVTCHDPHQGKELKDKTAFYREKCLSCHTTQTCKLEESERLKKEKNNCLACHMPQSATEIPHIAFTHHFIGRHLAKTPMKSAGIPNLVAVDDESRLGPFDRKRNLGLAYIDIYRNGMYPQFADAFRDRARENLESVYSAGLQDGETTAALAELYWGSRDFAHASKFAQEASTSRDISSLSRSLALLYLADCDRQDRNFSLAAASLEEAVRLRRTADSWRLLGVTYLDLNENQKALFALKEALAIRPYRFNTHIGLAEAYRRSGDVARSKEYLEKAKWLQDHNQD